MFTSAIVRKPGRSMIKGLTTASLGIPDYQNALNQHEKYIQALADCGLLITILEADEDYPDSCFVEDVALCTPKCAIITIPGAESRKGETAAITPVLNQFYANMESIDAPATLDAGDIMMVEDHYYIGLSDRTNRQGAEQMTQILAKYGYSSSSVELNDMLHLKTGVAYLGENTLMVCGEFLDKPEFKDFKIIAVPEEEGYAANCIRVNEYVILPSGYPITKKLLQEAGFQLLEVDVSEFKKLDGGLSCLSLRF